jgi:AcrR family transcriptional regulator
MPKATQPHSRTKKRARKKKGKGGSLSHQSASTQRGTRPVQARSQRTRTRILEAALELLAEEGPGAVTHRAVSQRADVSLGATTYYFGSRAALLEEVFKMHLRAVRKRAQETFDAFGPSESIGKALAHYVERDLREGRTGSIAAFELALVRARDTGLRQRLRPASQASSDFARQMLAALGSENAELDSKLLTAAISGLKLEALAEGERSAFARQLPSLLHRLGALLMPGDT